MKIRPAILKDAATIVRFQLAMAKETEDLLLDLPTVEKGVAAVFNDPSKGCYYIAEVDGQMVASLLTTFEWSDWRNGTVLWIQSVFVIQEYRRHGVFSAMYNYIKQQVETDSSLKGLRLYVEQNNTRARAVYEKLGMTAEHYQMYEWLKE